MASSSHEIESSGKLPQSQQITATETPLIEEATLPREAAPAETTSGSPVTTAVEAPLDAVSAEVGRRVFSAAEQATLSRITAELKAMTREEFFADIDRSIAWATQHHADVLKHKRNLDEIYDRACRLEADIGEHRVKLKKAARRIDYLMCHRPSTSSPRSQP